MYYNMNSFTYILSNYFPDIDIFKTAFEFPPDRNSPINQDFVSYSFINALHFGYLKYQDDNKINILNNSILKNNFLSPEKKEFYLNIFYKSQKIYHGFCKLAYIFKFKKAKFFDIDTDLFTNPLSTLKKNIIMTIYDDETKTKYRFRISDIISIIINSLSHAPDFFCDPQKIKNPYTNIPFSEAQLYNIYFTIKHSPYIMPHLFHLYFINKFNINIFGKKNECTIRDSAIQIFLKNASDDDKIYQIHKMIEAHSRELEGLTIADGFPKDKLTDAFNRYLKLYLEEAYSLNPTIRYQAKRNLKLKLSKFKKLNPSFGRKILMRNQNYLNQNILTANPFIFGNIENPAVSISSNERSFVYMDTYTLQSPRITPRQLNRRSRTSRTNRNAITSHVITSTNQTFEQITQTSPQTSPQTLPQSPILPPPISIVDDLITHYDEAPLPSISSMGDNLIIENNEQLQTNQLVNMVADESISVDDASEIETIDNSSPISAFNGRREILDIQNSLPDDLSIRRHIIRDLTNEIIEETNEFLIRFERENTPSHDEDENVVMDEEEIIGIIEEEEENVIIDEIESSSSDDDDDDDGDDDGDDDDDD